MSPFFPLFSLFFFFLSYRSRSAVLQRWANMHSSPSRNFLTRRGSGGRRSESRRRALAEKIQLQHSQKRSISSPLPLCSSAGRGASGTGKEREETFHVPSPSYTDVPSTPGSGTTAAKTPAARRDTASVTRGNKLELSSAGRAISSETSYRQSRHGLSPEGADEGTGEFQLEVTPLSGKGQLSGHTPSRVARHRDEDERTPATPSEAFAPRVTASLSLTNQTDASPNIEYARILKNRPKAQLPQDNLVNNQWCRDYLDTNHWRYFGRGPSKETESTRHEEGGQDGVPAASPPAV